jgi:hypothetical protein
MYGSLGVKAGGILFPLEPRSLQNWHCILSARRRISHFWSSCTGGDPSLAGCFSGGRAALSTSSGFPLVTRLGICSKDSNILEFQAVLTLGIDLAAQPENTAACLIHWKDGFAEVSKIVRDLDDCAIIDFLQGVDKAGIDVPLGWPTAFVHAISKHHDLREWPTSDRLRFRYRETDLFIHDKTGLWPLSVSTDRIGVTAMRAAALPLSKAERGDRSGSGKLIEVYPAAALCQWGFNSRRYKGIKGRETRLKLVGSFLQQTMSWLRVPAAQRSACEECDDVFDALIASLVARARAVKLTEPIPPRFVEQARVEGWIALPKADSLRELAVVSDANF